MRPIQRGWVAGMVVFMGLAACMAAGCGAKSGVSGAKVKGVLLQNGQPLKLLKDETVLVGFSMGEVGSSGEVKAEDGTFVVPGPTGNGLPPGQYKISISSQIYGGDGRNRFEGQFDTPKSPLSADVSDASEQMFEIDLAKKTVSKK